MAQPEEILKTKKTFALIGASQDMLKYSYELLFTLLAAGYTVYPINPRYENIEQHRCYPSLSELPLKPEVVIIALAEKNAETVVESVATHGISTVWLPPGSWSETAIAKAQAAGLEVLYNVCPIGTLRKMREERSS
jgi:predicted CoA-binding protein